MRFDFSTFRRIGGCNPGCCGAPPCIFYPLTKEIETNQMNDDNQKHVASKIIKIAVNSLISNNFRENVARRPAQGISNSG
jgi:hypothetical protein